MSPVSKRDSAALRRHRLLAMSALAILIWTYGFAYAVAQPHMVTTMNVVGPLSLAVVFAAIALLAVQRVPSIIWTPYAWLLGSSAAFFGVGPLAQVLGNGATLAYLGGLFRLSPRALLFTNLLDAAGLLAVLAGVHLAEKWFPLRSSGGPNAVPRSPSFRPEAVAVSFLLVGGALQYGVVLPSEFGIARFVLPGFLANLALMYVMGLVVAAYLSVSNRTWKVALWALWLPQLAVSFLTFSKQALLLSLVLPPVGAFLAHARLRRLLAWGLVSMLLYALVQPVVAAGRQAIYEQTGTIGQASLRERGTIVERYLARGVGLGGTNSDVQHGWTRFDYAPEQGLAVSWYNQGRPGNTLAVAEYVWIPRIIWPAKPVTTDLGVDFYELATGRRTTHLGLGIFAEGYWDFGWVGVAILSLLTGGAIGGLSRPIHTWMLRRDFVYLPAVFLGVTMGAVGVTQFFANSVVGALAIFSAYWAFIRLVAIVRSSSGRRAKGRGAFAA